MLTIFSTQLLK